MQCCSSTHQVGEFKISSHNNNANHQKKHIQTMAEAAESLNKQYFKYRLQKFEELKEKRRQEIGDKLGKEISITLLDGNVKQGKAYETTPYDIAQQVGLAQNAVVAKVNGALWDLGRVLEEDCQLEFLRFDAKEAQEVFWHSSSHVMGEALEKVYECLLCKGPPMEEGGFYYEAYMNDKQVLEADYAKINQTVNKIVKEKQQFERLVISKEEALDMFKHNTFKVEMLAEKVPENGTCTVYRCGDLIDPCKGPHLIHTGRVQAFQVTKNSSSYWRANSERESLQRVYAISFPDKKQLKEWLHFQEEAKKRDHRKVGKDQELWFFHPVSPGCVFMLPHGTRIFNTLIELTRNEYRKRGFSEVQTPTIYHTDLWKTSGHWDKYSDNMFSLEIDKCIHALKPMNCPAHCLMFKYRNRSYRELPIRFADFGVLHRNELKGALTGMTRVRRFQQDDAHIFCRQDQIGQEIKGALEFMAHMYSIFGFTFKLSLSTRPKLYLGEVEQWNKAEQQLEQALNEFGHPWTIAPEDGAFYGPKIDILVTDALRREHQCATIQLDFQLPIRFELEYADESSGSSTGSVTRPVIIHRAIYGSFERFLAIVTEHYGGKWPFWLSPRQAIVLPVSPKVNEYAEKVREELWLQGYYVDSDLSDDKIAKKVRNAQLAQYNYMLVVGAKEVENNSVNIRIRDEEKEQGTKTIPELIEMFNGLKTNFK
jgi:threonyl-tRNA synthetase